MKNKSRKVPELTRKNFANEEVWKDVDGRYHILIDDGDIEECDGYMLLFDPKNRQVSILHLEDGMWTGVGPYYTEHENWKYGKDGPGRTCKHCGQGMSTEDLEAHPRCVPA